MENSREKPTAFKAPTGLLTISYISHIFHFGIHLFTCTKKLHTQNDQLPVGLTVQLVEHCKSIAEIKGLNPVQARIFFHVYFSQVVKLHLTMMVSHILMIGTFNKQ